MNYAPENILEGAPNARDLGGMRTLDGGVFRPGRVIRRSVLTRRLLPLALKLLFTLVSNEGRLWP